MQNAQTPRLSEQAASLLAQAQTALSALGTCPRQLAAILLAADLCEEAQSCGLSWEETAGGLLEDSWECVRSDVKAAAAHVVGTEA